MRAQTLTGEFIGPTSGETLGPLAPLLRMPAVTDIAIDPDGSVWTDTGQGMRPAQLAIPLETPEEVRRLAIFLCARLGVPLDDAHPIADASTLEGLRLNALLPPLVAQGAAITVRVPSAASFGLDDLARSGFFVDPCLVPLLRGLVRGRASLLITGGTGTGKTTLLRALLREASPSDRIVAIEEVRELGTLDHPDVVSLAAREANAEGAGAVGLDELVRASLRMRPDRIILGECRGGEAADVLRAFDTGHRGGMLTVRADGVTRAPSRMVSLAEQGGMTEQQASLLLCGAFDAVLHCERRDGQRFLAQIGVIESAAPGVPVGRVLARCSTGGDHDSGHDGHRHDHGRLVALPGWQEFVQKWSTACSAADGEDLVDPRHPMHPIDSIGVLDSTCQMRPIRLPGPDSAGGPQQLDQAWKEAL